MAFKVKDLVVNLLPAGTAVEDAEWAYIVIQCTSTQTSKTHPTLYAMPYACTETQVVLEEIEFTGTSGQLGRLRSQLRAAKRKKTPAKKASRKKASRKKVSRK